MVFKNPSSTLGGNNVYFCGLILHINYNVFLFHPYSCVSFTIIHFCYHPCLCLEPNRMGEWEGIWLMVSEKWGVQSFLDSPGWGRPHVTGRPYRPGHRNRCGTLAFARVCSEGDDSRVRWCPLFPDGLLVRPEPQKYFPKNAEDATQMLMSLTSVGVQDRSTSSSTLFVSVETLCCCACLRLDSSRDSICSWHDFRQSCEEREIPSA